MAQTAERRRFTYADIEALPEHLIGEIIDGELHALPRPRSRHARAAVALDRRLGPPFDDGLGGPGGWWILMQPELHLGDDIVVPDLAGWRRERMAELPDVPHFELVPDWSCEILSASTERLDRGKKLGIYGRAGVAWVWLVNPVACTLEVLRRQEREWILAAVHAGSASVRAEPFEELSLELGALWMPPSGRTVPPT